MPQLTSSLLFTPAQAIAMLVLQLAAVGVWWRQNHVASARGGPIAFTKALWLVYAITIWLVAPICLTLNTAQDGLAMAAMVWGILAASMVARAVIELWMLRRQTWRVEHGIAHDRFHLAMAVVALVIGPLAPLGFLELILVVLTITSLACEIVFVRWFAAATAGPAAGIYFVPADGESSRLLQRSARLFLPQYAVFIGLLCLAIAIH